MTKKKKVTVILTSYNHAKYLQESIDSVLNQTYSDFELVIGDDASTDESWDIINSYTDPRIRAFRHENTKGGTIINKVVSEMEVGQYIAIHHSDDVWEPQKLEKQVAFLDANPQTGAVFTWVKIIDEKGLPFQDESHFYYKIFEQPNRSRYEWLNYFFYHGNALCHPSVLIRKKCYDDCGLYRSGLSQIGDFDMWVRLCLKYEIYVLQEKLVRYRVQEREGNSSGVRPETRVRSHYEFLHLLDNYRQITNFDDLKKIFPSAEKYEREGDEDIGFVLGMIALEASTQQYVELFGLTLLFEALNDSDRAKKILDLYDFSHGDFVELTAQRDIFSIEVIRNLHDQLADRDVQIQALDKQLHEITISKAWRMAMFLRRARVRFFPTGSWQLSLAKKLLAFLTFPVRMRRNYKVKKDMRLIQNSGYFDREWYILQNPDIVQDGIDPLRHFLLYGGLDGRDPGPSFSSEWYLSTYPNVKKGNINPLLHYLKFGRDEMQYVEMPGNPLNVMQESGSSKRSFSSTVNVIRKTIEADGGITGVVSKAWTIIRKKSVRYFLRRVRQRLINVNSVLPRIGEPRPVDVEYLRFRKFNVVPYYLDPYKSVIVNSSNIGTVAVHLHLFEVDALDECVIYLRNVPCAFDLFISCPDVDDVGQIEKKLHMELSLLKRLVVRETPDHGLNIAPLIVEFGKELLNYDFIAHVHHQYDSTHRSMDSQFGEVMSALFGSPDAINQILQRLQDDAKFVYPAPKQITLLDGNGWGENYHLAKELLNKLLNDDIERYPVVEFPQDSMFWATSAAFSNFLQFQLKYTDFSIEPVSANEESVHTIERLLLISAQNVGGRNYRIYSPDSTIREPYYENQNDYSEKIVHDTVKILSYYLPQFYPVPENDRWHGKGFTEWNKVRSSNPLFYGHYQQRVPHEDIGYYSLKTTEILKKQSELMKQAGVHGQVFYHYWFSGRLILEKPSRMLLEDKSIDMPFCFCWANENWTRKWDGNEDDILLGQTYSREDAEDFINYLVPFFKDERYIKVNGHPVLFIYRPSSIPDFSLYKNVWQKVCAKHNLLAPYVVAVLTRGAESPNEFGMDAGCERVLHDWTDGNVRDINETLYPYWEINGSVLDYNDVADFYMSQSARRDFTCFRSIVPSWDNSPRYGSDAYIVHNSTPEKFQEWLKYLVLDAEKRLPKDRQFVLINAWNEWAESAALDPDKRFGYSYLNAIGRALSEIRFDDREYLSQYVPTDLRVTITLSDTLIESLQENQEQKRKLILCLANSNVFSICKVSFTQANVLLWLEEITGKSFNIDLQNDEPDFMLYLNSLCYFAPDTFETLLKMALRYDVGLVIPSNVNDESFTHANLLERWELTEFSSSVMPPIHLKRNGIKRSSKCCVDASAFVTEPEMPAKNTPDVVSTIIRFHQSADLKSLQNALYSLLAQNACIVQPMIALQDLTDDKLEQVENMLYNMPWYPTRLPIVKKYHSDRNHKDLRALMLNDMLQMAQTKFVAFLDYDDILFPHAYDWLIRRLKKTGKNASFGLIYSTVINYSEQKIMQRRIVHDRGEKFTDFVDDNHTPLHGFMLDVSKIDLTTIEFHKNMKYMEDYFLTLQIFTEDDTDWESLAFRQFIGDYYYYEDKAQTLALSEHEITDVLNDPDYIACEEKISAMKKRVSARKRR